MSLCHKGAIIDPSCDWSVEVCLQDEALNNELDEATLGQVWQPDPQFAFLYNGLQERDIHTTKLS